MTASDADAGQVMGGRGPLEPPVSPCSLTSDGRSSPPAATKQPFSPVTLGSVGDLPRASVLGNTKHAGASDARLDHARDLMLVSCDAMPSATEHDGLNGAGGSVGGDDGATAPLDATAGPRDSSPVLETCSRSAPGMSEAASDVLSAAPAGSCVNFAQATSAVADAGTPGAPPAASGDARAFSEPQRSAGPAPRRSARARVPSAIAASAAVAPGKRERRRKRCDAFPAEKDILPGGKRLVCPSPIDDAQPRSVGPSPLELSKSRAAAARPWKPSLDLPCPPRTTASMAPGSDTPTAAADVKRQQLLARLHAINAEKARLAIAEPTPRHSVSSSQLHELLTPSCPPITPITPGSTLWSQGRSCASPAASTSTCGATALTALDLGSRTGGAAVAAAEPSCAGAEGQSTSTLDRVSRRPSRPRTPSVWLKPAPGEPVVGALTGPSMPSGWSRDPRVKYCRRMVNELLRHSQAKPFSAPVNELWPPESIPNYFVIVKQPMDLGTIKRTLEAGGYCSFDPSDVAAGRMLTLHRFESDVLQVFTNAMLYNRPGDALYQCAFSLRDEFQRLLVDMPEEVPPTTKGAARRGSRRPKPSPAVKGKKASSPQRGSPLSAANEAAPKASAARRAPKGKRPAKGALSDGLHQSAATFSGASGDGGGSCSPIPSGAGPRAAKVSPAPPQSVREIRRKLAQLTKERAYVEVFSMPHAKAGAGFMKRAAMLYHVEMRFEEKERLGNNISTLSVDKLGKVVQLVARKSAGRAEVNNNDEYELDMDALDNNTLREMEAYVEACLPSAKRRTVKDVSTYSSVGAIDKAMLVLRGHMTNILARREQARAHRRRMGSYSSEDSDSSDGDSSDSGSSDSGSRSSDSDSDSSSSGDSGSDAESDGE